MGCELRGSRKPQGHGGGQKAPTPQCWDLSLHVLISTRDR